MFKRKFSVFNKDWRGYLLKLRWRAAKGLAPRRRVEARGLSLTLQCDNWITHYRFATINSKERETLDWIDAHVKEGGLFFDIGANIGVYCLYAALRHPLIRVVAFEPEFSNLHLLRDNVAENGLKGRIQIYAIALGNRSGLSLLHIQDFTPGSALHTVSELPLTQTLSRKSVVGREGVWVMTLDAFCEETCLVPQAIKLDVDGNEWEVLEGASRTLSDPQLRTVLVEAEGGENRTQCEEILGDAGFRCQWRDPMRKSHNQIWLRNG